MVLQAARDHQLDLSQSFLVGDKASDMACAAAAGVRGYLYSGGRLDELVHTILKEGNSHEGL
jgi:D-glycero-D-manno-heptose 1,7-bisphosphate phosphatase